MALHKTLPDAELHEPKGVVGAASGTSYIANGAGSGLWKKVGLNEFDRTGFNGVNQYTQTMTMPNINVVKSTYSVLLQPGRLVQVGGAIDAGVTTDTLISFYRNGVQEIASAIIAATSVEGSRFVRTFPEGIACVPGDFIKVTSNGTGTGTTPLNITLLFLHSF